MTRNSADPRHVVAGHVARLERVGDMERLISEAWLQDLMHREPDVLPIAEIGSSWGPLVSLGRELQTSAGPMDNLFVSPTGEITLVEAKLWRNPQARREVVGQVLDYASCLTAMSYEDLENIAGLEIWPAVESAFPDLVVDEASFVDTVSRNLEAGRFLLLIVGDGIREDVEGLASLLANQAHLGFHLELVELRLFKLGDGLLVLPTLVGRTREVTRSVVEVRKDEAGTVDVSVQALPDEDDDETWTKRSFLAALTDDAERDACRMLIDRTEEVGRVWWGKRPGGSVVLHPGDIEAAPCGLWQSDGRARVAGYWNWYTRLHRHECFEPIARLLGQAHTGPASAVPLSDLDPEAVWAAAVESAALIAEAESE